jgi:hypothetical protein
VKALTFAVACVGLVACKNKEVPFKPPPKDAPAALPADAADIDAAVAAAKVGATKIVVGDHTTCAVMADATLRCWGKNSDGQLGNGTIVDSPKPVMPNLRGVTDVVLGTAHACALLDDRSVTCWGRINFGHKESLLAPAAAPGVAKVKRIFAVGNASCATLEDGPLVCFGDVDLQGHLRLAGPAVEHRVPTPAEGLDHVMMLTANGALHEDGTVSYWGTDGAPKKTPLAGVTEIASSGAEICGLRKDGSVACVGPTTVCAAAVPKPPPAPKKAAPKAKVPKGKVAPKGKATKPAAKGKAAPKGKVATPAPAPPPALAPVEVLRLPPAKHLAFDVGLCVVTKTGLLQCVSATDGCKQDSPWPGLANVETVSGSCARLHDGGVKCWSVDSKSRLVSSVAGVTKTREMSVSSSHACVLMTDQEILCWGSNKFGALGRGESDDDLHREAQAVSF